MDSHLIAPIPALFNPEKHDALDTISSLPHGT
jgi:hypothetical protein